MTSRSTLPCSVIVVGGSDDLRESLRVMLRQEAGLRLAGEAGTGAAALDLVFCCQPAVALVDVCLPDSSGFEVVKSIAQLAPACVAIMLSNAPDPFVEEVARMLGAKDVWHKSNDLGQLRQMLHRLVPAVLESAALDSTRRSPAS